eukprot:1038024-Pelagomonas_calceolata.AAC.1
MDAVNASPRMTDYGTKKAASPILSLSSHTGEYALACEHAHSCCVVLARPDRFLRDGRWHTWIDYHKCVLSVTNPRILFLRRVPAESPIAHVSLCFCVMVVCGQPTQHCAADTYELD